MLKRSIITAAEAATDKDNHARCTSNGFDFIACSVVVEFVHIESVHYKLLSYTKWPRTKTDGSTAHQLENVMSFATGPLTSPLTKTIDGEEVLLAIRLFSMINEYINLSNASSDSEKKIATQTSIVEDGKSSPFMTTELYFQLLKQTRNCDDADSERHVWRLFSIISQTISATQELRSMLKEYMESVMADGGKDVLVRYFASEAYAWIERSDLPLEAATETIFKPKLPTEQLQTLHFSISDGKIIQIRFDDKTTVQNAIQQTAWLTGLKGTYDIQLYTIAGDTCTKFDQDKRITEVLSQVGILRRRTLTLLRETCELSEEQKDDEVLLSLTFAQCQRGCLCAHDPLLNCEVVSLAALCLLSHNETTIFDSVYEIGMRLRSCMRSKHLKLKHASTWALEVYNWYKTAKQYSRKTAMIEYIQKIRDCPFKDVIAVKATSADSSNAILHRMNRFCWSFHGFHLVDEFDVVDYTISFQSLVSICFETNCVSITIGPDSDTLLTIRLEIDTAYMRRILTELKASGKLPGNIQIENADLPKEDSENKGSLQETESETALQTTPVYYTGTGSGSTTTVISSSANSAQNQEALRVHHYELGELVTASGTPFQRLAVGYTFESKYQIDGAVDGKANLYRSTNVFSAEPAFLKFYSNVAEVVEVRKRHVETRTVPNICKLVDHFNATEDHPYCLVFELGSYSLHDCLHKKTIAFSAEDRVRLLYEILTALNELHNRGIVHGDVQPKNIIWFSAEKRWKLADFDTARRMGQPRSDRQAFRYTPPEVLANRDNSPPLTADASADIWSFGVVMYEVLTGKIFGQQCETAADLREWLSVDSEQWLEDIEDEHERHVTGKALTRNPLHRRTAEHLFMNTMFKKEAILLAKEAQLSKLTAIESMHEVSNLVRESDVDWAVHAECMLEEIASVDLSPDDALSTTSATAVQTTTDRYLPDVPIWLLKLDGLFRLRISLRHKRRSDLLPIEAVRVVIRTPETDNSCPRQMCTLDGDQKEAVCILRPRDWNRTRLPSVSKHLGYIDHQYTRISVAIVLIRDMATGRSVTLYRQVVCKISRNTGLINKFRKT